ncbi:MAG: SurA N-terminal domain-containing protein [Pseudomonadota bacterium]
MLETMRKGAKSWLAKGLVALLIASFAVWGIGDIFSFSLSSAVATVGEEEVTAEQYADALQRQQAMATRQTGRLVSLAEMREYGLDQRVLANLVRDAAYAAELDSLGIAASDEAVATMIREMPEFRRDDQFSDRAYRGLLAEQGMSPREFEDVQRALLGQSVLRGAVSGTTTLPPGAATRIAAHQGEQRSVSVLRLPRSIAADPTAPGPETLSAYFETNAEAFREPERRFGRYLSLSMSAVAAAHEPSDDEIAAAYETRRDDYRQPASAEIDQINFPGMAEAEAAAARLAGGEEFAALAGEQGLSEADVALGRVAPEDLPPAVAEAVFALTEPGIAGPVETALGAAILRVRAITAETVAPLESVRDALASRLSLDAAYRLAPELAGEIEELRASGLGFDEIADRLDAVEGGEIPGWAADNTLTGEAEPPALFFQPDIRAEIAEALDGEERDIVELEDGSFFLVEIDRIEPARLPELDEIRPRVVTAWEEAQRDADLLRRGRAIVEALGRGTGATLASTAAGLGRPVDSFGPFARDTAPATLPATLLPGIFTASPGDALTASDPSDGSAVVVVLDEITALEPTLLEQTAEQLDAAFRTSLARDQGEYFARAMETEHGAVFDPSAIEEVFRLLGAAHAGMQ